MNSENAELPLKPEPGVVGIGASAAGLAALIKVLLAHVPPDSDPAFVVVVHLSPDHESHLAEILQPHVPQDFLARATKSTRLAAEGARITADSRAKATERRRLRQVSAFR